MNIVFSFQNNNFRDQIGSDIPISNNNFDMTQFSSYQNILATKGLNATIESYKTYITNLKKSGNNDNNTDLSISLN